jgi:hypothetical protein
MKGYKLVDFWINLVMIVVGFIIIIIENEFEKNNSGENYEILVPCLFWGISQSISMIVHLYYRKNWKYPIVRYGYTLLALVVLIYSCIIRFNNYNHAYFLPVMALFYISLCGFETYSKTHKITEQL